MLSYVIDTSQNKRTRSSNQPQQSATYKADMHIACYLLVLYTSEMMQLRLLAQGDGILGARLKF